MDTTQFPYGTNAWSKRTLAALLFVGLTTSTAALALNGAPNSNRITSRFGRKARTRKRLQKKRDAWLRDHEEVTPGWWIPKEAPDPDWVWVWRAGRPLEADPLNDTRSEPFGVQPLGYLRVKQNGTERTQYESYIIDYTLDQEVKLGEFPTALQAVRAFPDYKEQKQRTGLMHV